jgi:hypothetical protein
MTRTVRLAAQPPPDTLVSAQHCNCPVICPYCGCIGYGGGLGPTWQRTVTCYCCGLTFRT